MPAEDKKVVIEVERSDGEDYLDFYITGQGDTEEV